MSYHSTIEGRITYSVKSDRDAVLAELEENGWETTTKDNEAIHAVSSITGVTCNDEYVVLIPRAGYHNLGKHIELLTDSAVDWKIIESTGDGALEGYVQTPGGTDVYNLPEWVRSHNTELARREPEKEAFDTVSDWFDVHVEWQVDVEYFFLEYMKEEVELDFTPFLAE